MGDPEAGQGAGDDALFERLYPGLRRFAAVTAVDAEPDDLVQEAVARTLRVHALADLDDPAAYLRRAILNLAVSRRRRLARGRAALARLGGRAAEEGRLPEYASDLADLLRLSPDARALLYLVEVEGRSYADVAAMLGVSEEAARARAARARRRLRDDLGGED